MSDGEDPVAWLRAQVEARKALAEAATQVPWEPEGDDLTDDEVWIDVDGEQWRHVICRGPQSHENMLHVALNDPRDVIARCEAELAILDEHGPDDTFGPDDVCCCACGDRPQVPFPCRTVRVLLGAYKHQPGFKAEWAS